MTSTEILAELGSEDDGLIKRSIGPWTLEKLAVLLLYIRGFADACQKAGGGFYVDGLSGPGLCEVDGAQVEPYFVRGSPLIALMTPELQHCVLMELEEEEETVLGQRAERFGPRATVRRGDVNRDLPSLIREVVPGRAPCFCLLDPEAAELHWETIAQIARTPGRRKKPELLILFPLEMSIIRQFPTGGPLVPGARDRHNRTFGNENWEEIYRRRLTDELAPGEAKDEYLELYKAGLKNLGYRHVVSKPVLAPPTPTQGRQERYHLVFATDDDTGDRIMRHVFERGYVLGAISGGQKELGV